jgi:cysteine-rich repeat protein
VNPTGPRCGDSIINGSDECDDGNTVNTDACNNLCQLVDGCGDGNIDAGEACDDNNITAGDGCSATCQPDISCGAGETPVIVTNAIAGGTSVISIPNAGLVRRVIATVDVTYPTNGHVDLFLRSPWGVLRDLSSDQAGANHTRTIFSDSAATLITAGTAPYSGAFRPEQAISGGTQPTGFGNQSSQGTWSFIVNKDTTGATGTINRWTLALCVDASAAAVCGNGTVEAAETCDDLNTTAADGCSATCQVELTCPAGSSPLIARGTNLPLVVPDSLPAGVTSNAVVSATGTVTKAIAVLGTITHQFQSDLDISLVSPMGTVIDLTSDNGSTNDDWVSVIFDDAAAGTAVAPLLTPLRGRFKPETVAGMAVVNTQPANGNWGLLVVDDTAQDLGIIVSWTVALCVAP